MPTSLKACNFDKLMNGSSWRIVKKREKDYFAAIGKGFSIELSLEPQLIVFFSEWSFLTFDNHSYIQSKLQIRQKLSKVPYSTRNRKMGFWKSTLFDPFLKKWRRPLFGVSTVCKGTFLALSYIRFNSVWIETCA